MLESRAGMIVDADGLRGEIVHDRKWSSEGTLHVMVRMEDGRRLWVPEGWLEQQHDGEYLLPLQVASLPTSEPGNDSLVIPVLAETLTIRRRKVSTGGVRVRKRVHEEDQVVEPTLTSETVEVERVPINQQVTQIPQVRQEGDTTIVPILEEVVVVEKRLILREEVRITRRRRQSSERHEVTLRREEVEVERLSASDAGGDDQHQEEPT